MSLSLNLDIIDRMLKIQSKLIDQLIMNMHESEAEDKSSEVYFVLLTWI